MTSFRKPITSKSWFYWFERHLEFSAALFVFLLLWVHGSTLGLSDDEAYYWVLAQKPSLGYAFHPPAVAWMIAISELFLSPFFGLHSEAVVRFPAALSSGFILWLVLDWLKFNYREKNRHFYRTVGLILSFFGFFGLSWMVVPDIPLFLGLTLAFVSTYRACEGGFRSRDWVFLVGGVFLALLGKFSGVLVGVSAIVCIARWGVRGKRRFLILAVLLGMALASLPTLVWNSQHEWGSLLYQIRDRHGGSWSGIRYLRFWATQLALAGPFVIVSFLSFILSMFKKTKSDRLVLFGLAWALPPATVFLLQPFYADFKPHWALVVWWPVLLVLVQQSQKKAQKWIKAQLIYGLGFGAVLLFICHFPILGWLGVHPKNDVTNDLFGWKAAASELEENREPLPEVLVGSRYQTAGQAAFNFPKRKVTFLPRDRKEFDEWPDLKVSHTLGPQPVSLNQEVLFVSDSRYSAEPDFKNAKCEKLFRSPKKRFSLSVGWIDIWRCRPS
ncbi:MAG: glycosyltransferase family 39 protein [Bdellovibrio sp.]|nr:glycosyltransferase family 39 protein [Bdellovibrio sp.]